MCLEEIKREPHLSLSSLCVYSFWMCACLNWLALFPVASSNRERQTEENTDRPLTFVFLAGVSELFRTITVQPVHFTSHTPLSERGFNATAAGCVVVGLMSKPTAIVHCGIVSPFVGSAGHEVVKPNPNIARVPRVHHKTCQERIVQSDVHSTRVN